MQPCEAHGCHSLALEVVLARSERLWGETLNQNGSWHLADHITAIGRGLHISQIGNGGLARQSPLADGGGVFLRVRNSGRGKWFLRAFVPTGSAIGFCSSAAVSIVAVIVCSAGLEEVISFALGLLTGKGRLARITGFSCFAGSTSATTESTGRCGFLFGTAILPEPCFPGSTPTKAEVSTFVPDPPAIGADVDVDAVVTTPWPTFFIGTGVFDLAGTCPASRDARVVSEGFFSGASNANSDVVWAGHRTQVLDFLRTQYGNTRVTAIGCLRFAQGEHIGRFFRCPGCCRLKRCQLGFGLRTA